MVRRRVRFASESSSSSSSGSSSSSSGEKISSELLTSEDPNESEWETEGDDETGVCRFDQRLAI